MPRTPAEDGATTQPDAPAKGGGSWLMFVLRWTIAIVGITWVLSGITIRDRVYVLLQAPDGQGQVVRSAALVEPFEPGGEDGAVIEHPLTGEPTRVDADRLMHGPDRDTYELRLDGEVVDVEVAGMTLHETPSGEIRAGTLYYYTPAFGDGYRVASFDFREVATTYDPQVPQPLVLTGLGGMVREARPGLLVLAFAVFPVTLVCTGLRWWRLMTPLGIRMSLGRAYVLNMVGLFYNSFMLGSTGGDFVKAFYAGRHAEPGRKAAAWMSVFIDRVAGLLVLVAIGGTASMVQYALEDDRTSPVAVACLQVGLVAAALLLAAASVSFVLASAPTRRLIRHRSGLSRLIGPHGASADLDPEADLPLRHRLRRKARSSLDSLYEVADAYRSRPVTLVEAALLTVPVHLAVIVSAMLAGFALGLPIPWPYYFVCVPVMILMASMPVSPQGAGVMEFFAVLLTRPQGATVAQAFALALSIRILQVFWNLTGGYFVLRGGYQGPGEQPAAAADGEPDDLQSRPVAA